MKPLKSLVAGYLRACDYNVREEDRYVIADRPGLGELFDSIVVWTQEDTPESPDRVTESTLLSRLGQLSKRYFRAGLVFLTHTREGLSRDFSTEATELGFRIKVPVEFFDAAFRSEEAREATDAARQIVRTGDEFRSQRVKQAFRLITPSGEHINGPDIVAHLTQDMVKRSETARIRFILGPAGCGKSIAFNELYADLYAAFQARKRKRVLAKRPIPLLPEHLRLAVGTRVSAIMDAFLRTDVATPLRREALTWLIDNQFMCLMLDGLDEILIRDKEYFDFLLDRLTTPDSLPDILICVRDSLLSSCDLLADFLEDAAPWVERYELQPWDRASKKQYAAIRFASDQKKATDFVEIVESSGLKTLSSLPFYCRCLADQFARGDLNTQSGELDVLDAVLKSIVQREYDKNLVDATLLPADQIAEWLSATAAVFLDKQMTAIPLDELKAYGAILLPAEVDEERRDEIITHLAQFAIFQKSSQTGSLLFSHEILGYFLVAQYLVDRLTRNPDSFERDMGLMDFLAHDPLLRLLAKAISRAQKSPRLTEILLRGVASDVAYRNVLQTAVYCCPLDFAGNECLCNFSGRDLSNVVFENIDFSGANFRQSDLSSTSFVSCLLRGARFEGAIIKNTRFLLRERSDMQDAHFGTYDTVFSIRTESRYLGEIDAARKWLQERTCVPPPTQEPCATAYQLRHLFGKFVYPNGEPRRAELDIKGVLAGKRYVGAPSPEECVKEAVSLGYLRQEPGRKSLHRPDGQKYREIVEYVARLRLTKGLSELLDRLCPEKRCPHIPTAT